MKRKAMAWVGVMSILSLGAGQPDGTGKPDAAMMEPPNSKPVAEHKLLERFAGTWDYTVTLTFGPGQESKAAGKTVGKMIVGDRFMRLESEGPMMGREFQQMVVLGFDTRVKKYTLWGIDSFGTYSVSATGTYDEPSKTLMLEGENEEPGMGKMAYRWRYVFTDETHITQVLQLKFGENWMQIVEVKFVKAK